jgi:protocatechuate 3,4-dioxygenase beta subunit
MNTNEPMAGPRRNATKTWLLIGLIVLLAVLVPVGLYFVSTIPFTNGTTGSNLSVPDTGVVPITAPPANGTPAAGTGRPTANTATGKTLDLVLIDQVTGRPIAGLRVQNNLRNRFTGTSDTDGRVPVPIPLTNTQYFYIRANGKGYIPKRLAWSTNDASLGGGDIPSAYTMKMEKGTKIHGTIVDDAGQPVTGATVFLDFNKKYSNPHEQVDVNGNNRTRPIKSGDDGTWSFSGAPLNCDEIRLGAWDYQHVIGDFQSPWPIADAAKLYDGTATFALRRGVTLEGVVTGPDGDPLAGASVGIGDQRMYGNASPAETTDASGEFSYHFDPGQQVTLTIQARGCAPELKQLTMGADKQTLAVALSKAHRIYGRVVDSSGKPIPDANFNIQTWRGVQTLTENFQSDGSGNFHWNEAPADAVMFNISSRSTRGTSLELLPDKENVVKLGSVIHIRGTVTDAETGQPIEDFHLTLGIVFNEGQQVNWQPGWNFDIGKKPGGVFDFPDTWSYPGIAVRIDARGHLSVESQVVKPEDGDAQLGLKMKPGKDVAATIHAPDGSLVSGATAVMALPRQMAYIIDSRQVMNQGTPRQTSGADGVVDFPPQSGHFKIAVFADAGYAEVDQDDLAKSSDITLSPWGRIEGKMMIGSAPASDKFVDLMPAQIAMMVDPDEIRVQNQISAKTDADGKFVVERIPPGTWSVSRRVQISQNSYSDAALQTVEVAAGKTVAMSVGGTGRPVVGKVILPPSLVARSDWAYSFCQIRSNNNVGLPMPPVPLLVRMLSEERQQQWMQNWLKTDEGKAYTAKQQKAMADIRNYPFAVSADGTFRIDDVPAGDYQMSISVQRSDPHRGYGGQLGIGSAGFTVPEMPGGRSDEPLQIDPVNVIALGKYKVGDPVYDLSLRSTEAKDLKISDFHGKYLLLDFFHPMDASIASFKQIYAEYPPDDQLALLTINTGMAMPGQTLSKMYDNPWHQAVIIMRDQSSWSVLNSNFDAQNSPGAWLIGPDGKVVAEDLTGDGIQAAVTAAIGPPTVAAAPATQPTTMP